MLQARSISSNGVGMRINKVARMVTSATARTILPREPEDVLSSSGFDELDFSEIAIMIHSPAWRLLCLYLVWGYRRWAENLLYSDGKSVIHHNDTARSEPGVFEIQIRRRRNGFVEFQY